MIYNSERDVEIPALFNFLETHAKEIESVLDVGCYGSQYLKELQKYKFIVDGIDISFGETEKQFLANYFTGNIVDYSSSKYDLVICLSTLEHSGIEQYQVKNWLNERYFVIEKISSLATKFIFLTFPYGIAGGHPNFFENVTREQLDKFKEIFGDVNFSLKFFVNSFPQSGQGWLEISQSEADKEEYDPTKGVQSVCVLEIKK